MMVMNPYLLLCPLLSKQLLALDIGKSLPVLRSIWIAAYRQDKGDAVYYYGLWEALGLAR